jgi:hypothetical protein
MNPSLIRFCSTIIFTSAITTFTFAQGPTKSTTQKAAISWPTKHPSRIYVLPFSMDKALADELAKDDSLIPKGPLRKAADSRPRVTDAVTGHDRNTPIGQSIAMQVAKNLTDAGLPAVFWNQPTYPQGEGWRLTGQIVSLNEGNKVAQNAIGFGAGNKKIAVDAAISDPTTGGGQPFFLMDTSDSGRKMPGTAPVAIIAGFNPIAIASKTVVSNSGIKDSGQQHRIASEISNEILASMKAHGQTKTK